MKLANARDEEKATMMMLKNRGDEELDNIDRKKCLDALRLLYHSKMVGHCAEDASRALLRFLMLVHEIKITLNSSYPWAGHKIHAVYTVVVSCFFSAKKAGFNIPSSEKASISIDEKLGIRLLRINCSK